MDVHYLPSNRHIKSAKEYFIDTIIIFLAVILGFLGNDFRISYTEKAKTKVYAQSLYDDLKNDQVSIGRITSEKEWIKAKYDSAEVILATKNLYDYNEFIYYVERYMTKKTTFISQDITFQHLFHSGNSTIIKNIKLTKQIVSYYNLYNQYAEIEKANSDNNELSNVESKLFNPRDLTSLDTNNDSDFYKVVIRPNIKLKPIKRDVENLKLFYIKINNAKEQIRNTKEVLSKLNIYGSGLMNDLKNEYDLK